MRISVCSVPLRNDRRRIQQKCKELRSDWDGLNSVAWDVEHGFIEVSPPKRV